uniref:EH domain-containing protein n=3 Tax=Macrostomum lignano TaxID=282301 RepID=A0A1I8HCR5_9PLAT
NYFQKRKLSTHRRSESSAIKEAKAAMKAAEIESSPMETDATGRLMESDCASDQLPAEVEDFSRRLQICLSHCCKSMPGTDKLASWQENGGAGLIAELASLIAEGGGASDGAILLAVRQLSTDQLRILWAYLTTQLTAVASSTSNQSIDMDLLVTWLDLLLTANFTQLAAAAGTARPSPGPISAESLASMSDLIDSLAELQFQHSKFEALLDALPIVVESGRADQRTSSLGATNNSNNSSSQSSYSIVKVSL